MSDRVFQRQWLITTFLPWIKRQPCGAWFMTGGNHDFVFQSSLVRDTLPLTLLDGLLLDRTAEVFIGSERIRVHGSPWSLPFCNWAFMASESDMQARLEAVPHHVDVLMVHGPPWGIGDRTVDRMDAGSRSLLNTIETKMPRLSLHGHIHEGFGQGREIVTDGRTTIVRNVSYLNERYEPTNPPTYFTLPPPE